MSSGFQAFCGGAFWNETLLVDNWWPQFTGCFQSTLLLWLPPAWLFLCCTLYIPYILARTECQVLPVSLLNVVKSVGAAVLVFLCLLSIIHLANNRNNALPVASEFVGYGIKIVSYIATIILVQIDRRRGVLTSWILFIYWMLELFTSVIPFYTLIIEKRYETDTFTFVLFVMSLSAIVLENLLQFVVDVPKTKKGYVLMDKRPCPEVTASFPSQLAFFWMTNLVTTGYWKGLKEEDLWELNPRDNCATLVPRFQREWSKETEHLGCKECAPNMKGPGPRSSDSKPLFRVIFKLTYLQVLWQVFLKTTGDGLVLLGPVVMSELIDYVSHKGSEQRWKGVLLAVLLSFLSFAKTLFMQHSMNLASVLGMQIKTMLMCGVYRKALTQNNEARKTSSTGEIVNLMSVDCQRINDAFTYLFILLSMPARISMTVWLLYRTVGASVFAGLCVLMAVILFNSLLGTLQRRFQANNLRFKDQRIKLLNEILNGIKVLKLYAWEASFKKKIEDIRKSEIRELRKCAYINVISDLNWTSSPFLVIFTTFTSYLLADPENQLDANKAFVTLSLFSLLRVPITTLSVAISYNIQAYVSTKRISEFLSTEDLDDGNVEIDEHAENAIEIANGTFRWDKSSSNCLTNINVKIPKGKLVAIVGHVGSGKSSLISAMLGEMEKVSGKVTLKSSTAYVPQQAWIQNASVRENILFGKKYREKKYETVISACALEPDLDILAAGDQTEIGEKGINLSGGQKQRVSLARAVYSNANIYLFDDPLSAVDSHVGKHIFTNIMGNNGLLKRKTRVLVTHGIHWLPMVDHIIVLGDGVITEAGSYEELVSVKGAFSQFLKTYLTEVNEEEEHNPGGLHVSVWDDGYSSEETTFTDFLHRRNLSVHTCTSKLSDVDEEQNNGIKDELILDKLDSVAPWSSRGERQEKQRSPDKREATQMNEKGRLIQIETMETGKVHARVFLDYAKAAGLPSFLLTILLIFVFQAINTGSSFFLSSWTDDPRLHPDSQLTTQQPQALKFQYLGLYACFGVAMLFVILVYSYLFWTRMIRAAERLHAQLLSRVFHSPMSFFDTTPVGRIINRLSRDVETIDNNLPLIIGTFLQFFVVVLSIIIIICIKTPLFITMMLPLVVIFYVVQKFYIPTSRQLKRMESVTRSPMYVHFAETLAGASSIRAYRAAGRFLHEFKTKVDGNQVFVFGSVLSSRWLSFNLDLIGTTVLFGSAIFAVVAPDISGGELGLSVSYALQIASSMSWMVKLVSDLETNIVSVERVKEYSELPTEAEWYKSDKPPRDWPHTGTVELYNYMTRYREGLDLVLKGVTCVLQGGQKIGIVGRTGAGKSSFTLAMFRILEAAGGDIIIDGINIANIGLQDLRSKLTILPQEPLLFSGSLRMNLDPFDEFSDFEVWQAIEQAHLKKFVVETPKLLMSECGEGGENLSVGQRQLVCLARALLRHTKILVLDEATASVDMETDSLIQETIRDAFSECTVITIAHRLKTVLDCDRIIVMDAGTIAEFDKPDVLLSDTNTIFYGLARNAGLV